MKNIVNKHILGFLKCTNFLSGVNEERYRIPFTKSTKT